MPDVAYVAAGKYSSTGHLGTSQHVLQDDSSPTISRETHSVDELQINYNS
jgi:hypothetical protein